jgi:hypothetical protein
LKYACELSDQLDTIIEDFYDYVFAGATIEEAQTVYSTFLEEALVTAVDDVVGVTITKLEYDVQISITEDGIQEALEDLETLLATNETLADAIKENYALIAAMSVS